MDITFMYGPRFLTPEEAGSLLGDRRVSLRCEATGAGGYVGGLQSVTVLRSGELPEVFPPGEVTAAELRALLGEGADLLLLSGSVHDPDEEEVTVDEVTLVLTDPARCEEACRRLAEHCPRQRVRLKQLLLATVATLRAAPTD